MHVTGAASTARIAHSGNDHKVTVMGVECGPPVMASAGRKLSAWSPCRGISAVSDRPGGQENPEVCMLSSVFTLKFSNFQFSLSVACESDSRYVVQEERGASQQLAPPETREGGGAPCRSR